jgi:hypothetical protein
MWYPEINLGVKQIYRTFQNAQDENVPTVNSQVFAGLRLPLRTTAGAWDQYLSVGPTYTFGDARERGGEGPGDVLQFDYMEHDCCLSTACGGATARPCRSWPSG